MRTTLDLDEDVLLAVRELARRHRHSLGKEISRLVRIALQHRQEGAGEAFAGFEPFPARDRETVTEETIDRLREQEGI